MTDAARTYALTVEEARQLLLKLTERVEDNLGHSADEVNWGHVGEADHMLALLKQAAERAGISVELL